MNPESTGSAWSVSRHLPVPVAEALARGVVVPAMPLALDARRRLDERRQRALIRYYADAGAGGLAVGVHTTQFAIREAGLYPPLLALARVEMDRADSRAGERAIAESALTTHDSRLTTPLVRIGGICGGTQQAVAEAELLREHGFHAGLLSLAALKDADDAALLAHCRAVAEVIPVIGFYLQPAVGGRRLPYRFWREFAEIERVLAIKIAPFDRYATLDVVRAVAESAREEIALYTGNDDSIVHDLITPFQFEVEGGTVERRIVGGLLGHWAVWTRRAVELLEECHRAVDAGAISAELLRKGEEVTDCNAAFFDAANGYAGCIAGLHEVLRRQGLLEGLWLLDPDERLSPGQLEEIDRVYRAYPHLHDDTFVAANLPRWLS